MIYFWILLMVLLCIAVYAFDQQTEVDPEVAKPRKLVIRLIVWALRLLRQVGRNIVQGFKHDVAGIVPRSQLKKREQQSSEQQD